MVPENQCYFEINLSDIYWKVLKCKNSAHSWLSYLCCFRIIRNYPKEEATLILENGNQQLNMLAKSLVKKNSLVSFLSAAFNVFICAFKVHENYQMLRILFLQSNNRIVKMSFDSKASEQSNYHSDGRTGKRWVG